MTQETHDRNQYRRIDKNLIGQIEKIVGRKNVLSSKEDLLCYGYDATNLEVMPDLVVFPSTVNEISQLLKLANEHKFPIVPRGMGTGFSGGSIPVHGGVVLVITRFNRILEIDGENLIAVVEPGVITGDFQKQVEKLGFFYPPDPASQLYCTLGGNVAECAGGPRAIKYGVTKDYVLGLEVVLPAGEAVNTGVRTVKGVVGYDLTKLFVGSEGTLGIITKIILKLIPLPEARKTMMGIFRRWRMQPRPFQKSSAQRLSLPRLNLWIIHRFNVWKIISTLVFQKMQGLCFSLRWIEIRRFCQSISRGLTKSPQN